LRVVQDRLEMQPLQLPSLTLGSWYMNRKALYFYNSPEADFLDSRQVIQYSISGKLLAILNAIHGSAYNASDFTPGQQVLAIGLASYCHQSGEKLFNVSIYQECSHQATRGVGDILADLSNDQWTLDDSVKLAASSHDLLVATAIESIAETIEKHE
jgi:hypothetical protein